MNIILASEVIHPGGAETFILRLAKALHESGHNVRVFVFYKHLLNRELCNIIAPGVTVTPAKIPAAGLLSKIDGLLFRLNIDFSLRYIYIKRSLKKTIQEQKTEVIHSHLLKVDALCLDVAIDANIPVVHTIHGDYLQFFEKTAKRIPIPLLNYREKAQYNLDRVAQTVCISEKQLSFFKTNFLKETHGKLEKIYNGYKATVTEEPTKLREQLGLKEEDFVFGMVSRGIPDKGWQVAIDAFIQLNRTNAHLVLTGSGDYLASLKEQYRENKNIHFTGHSDNPVNWINIFDVGLLPSTYPSESLPTVIIEYLYCNIPVIASDAGEIMNMTGQAQHPAGIIVKIEDGKIDATLVKDAMSRYMNDKELYVMHQQNAAKCYTMFDMDKCVQAYTTAYKKAITDTPR